MRVRPSTAALASVFCVSLLLWSSAGRAQDLGPGRGRLIERGPVDIQQLTRQAALIVQGTVAAKEPKWIGRVIYTQYDVVVRETVKGTPRSGVLVAVVGGAMGNVQLTVPGAPDLHVGDQLLFFGVPIAGESGFSPVGTFDGIVPISAGRGSAPATVAPRGKPEALEGFLQELRTLSSRP
jgi:hypothetical protein